MSALEDRPPDRGVSDRRAAAGSRTPDDGVSTGSDERSDQRLTVPGDPLTYLVGLVALVVYVLHGFDGRLSRDLAVYAYAGQQVADGVPPYEGILNRSGPLAHLAPGLGAALARVGGFEDVLGMRLVFLAIAVGSVCLVYVLARTVFASRCAGLAAGATFLAFHGFIEYASNGPREKTLMVFFLLCTLLAVVKRRWLTAGSCLGLAALVWQPAVLVGLPAIVVALLALHHGQRVRALIRLVVGALIPAGICLAYFTSVGALGDLVNAFVRINAQYTEPSPFWAKPGGKWARVEDAYGLSAWILLAGLASLTILAFLALRGDRRRESSVSVAAIGLAAVVGLAVTLGNFNGWPDAFLLLPFAAFGIGGIVAEAGDRLRRPHATGLLTAMWVVVTVAIAVTYATTERRHGLERQRDQVAVVLERLPSDASILSIEAPQPLVLAGMTNPTRHQMFVDGLDRYVDDTWPRGLAGFADWVGRQQPTVIAIGRHGVPPWLRQTIRGEYRYGEQALGWTWYFSRSVAPQVG